MTEAEILATRNDVTAILVSVVSVSFAMISAYIVALWAFLRQAPKALRLIAFSVLSMALAFCGGVALGLHHLMLGTERAWSKLPANVMGIPGFGNERPDFLMGLSYFDAVTALGGLAFGLIYLALMVMTFVYRWPDGAVSR